MVVVAAVDEAHQEIMKRKKMVSAASHELMVTGLVVAIVIDAG